MADAIPFGDLFVLAPTFPGDLVASRALLAALGARGSVAVAVMQSLAPILRDLPVALQPYSTTVSSDVHDAHFCHELELLGVPANACVLDLIGTPPTMAWLSARGGPSTGYCLDRTEHLPYTTVVEWAIPPANRSDRSHYGVRLLRVLPEHATATSWPDGCFERALYKHGQPALFDRIALVPGCGRWGLEKRMPVSFWRAVAAEVRSRAWRPTWFLGPDEVDLAADLVERGDAIVSGTWDDALNEHARCAVGVSNDTSHLHVRAHLGRQTLAFFRRDDAPEWGHYPGFVTCIDARQSLDDGRAVEAAVAWLTASHESRVPASSGSG